MLLRRLGPIAAVLGLAVATAAGAAGSAGALPPWGTPGPPPAADPDPAIDLLGTWGLDVVDPDGICVSIFVPDWVPDRDAYGSAIADAVRDWGDALDAAATTASIIVLTVDNEGTWGAPDGGCAVAEIDVTIEMQRGGGRVQGTTKLSYESGASYDPPSAGSFIEGAHIDLRGKFAGTNNTPADIGLIARHELGHALGVGHWNVGGHLMSSTLVADTDTQPNACEVEAALVANGWFTTGENQPAGYAPGNDPYLCSP